MYGEHNNISEFVVHVRFWLCPAEHCVRTCMVQTIPIRYYSRYEKNFLTFFAKKVESFENTQLLSIPSIPRRGGLQGQ